MSWLRLSQIADMVGGRLIGADAAIESLTIDSRTLSAGQLFVALRGTNFDGYDFVPQAFAARAGGVLVGRDISAGGSKILVEDTLVALQRLAARWRDALTMPVIALTGSNGKTTVKEMIASVLSREGSVLATRGNLNNHIGVPLTLLSIRPQHAYAVVEMGANHPGEIAALTALVRPDLALITNAAAAHLEGFGSIEGVARSKGEIFQGLCEDGTAIINADDQYADYWRGLNKRHKRLSFGIEHQADVQARALAADQWRVTTPQGEFGVKLRLPGRHNVRNALAAAAVSIAAGVNLIAVKAGLESVRTVRGRLVARAGHYGARLLDDSYNANPSSLAAALDVLTSAPGEHWLVLGDMAELGDNEEVLHQQAGESARRAGVTRLFAVGALSRATVGAFGEGASHFESHAALIGAVIKALDARAPGGISVLVKGSRSARMEKVVEALVTDVGCCPPGAEQGYAA